MSNGGRVRSSLGDGVASTDVYYPLPRIMSAVAIRISASDRSGFPEPPAVVCFIEGSFKGIERAHGLFCSYHCDNLFALSSRIHKVIMPGSFF